MSETDRQLLDRFEAIIREAVNAIAASNAVSMQISERLRAFETRLERTEKTMLIAAQALERLSNAEIHRAEIEEETLNEMRETKKEMRNDIRSALSHPIALMLYGGIVAWILQYIGAPNSSSTPLP